MKKITYLLIAALSVVSVASCVKELTPEPAFVGGADHEFTISLPPATRTALQDGKTVWAKGDSIWVYNGVASESIVVPEEAWGQKEFKFIVKVADLTDTTKKIYVVYPYAAAAGVADGKVKVKVPAVQDGTFANANIAAAVAEDYNIALKNVTGVLKVTVPATDTPVYQLSISAANGNALTGTCSVDFSGDAPALTPDKAGSNVSVPVDAFAGDFYVAVVPGTYDAGFKMTAASVDFEHASETKVTTVANTVKVNDLVDLGQIGTNLQPLTGDGTEASPWMIENLGHMIALATAVNNGESFEGKYLKVANDIEGINTPVGSFPNAENNNPFQGDFDGGNHTLTLDINGADQPHAIRLGLFGALNAGAHIHDLVIAGNVTSTGDAIGGLAGRVDGPAEADSVYIENVTNKATVSGPNYVGGLIGYATVLADKKLVIRNCSNEGKVSASSMYAGGMVGSTFDSQRFIKVIDHCTNSGAVYANATSGGMVGKAYYTNITDCENTGSVSASSPYNGIHTYSGGWKYLGYYDRGTGGIVGFTQNGKVDYCKNSGPVSGVCHVGGVAGVTYWTNPSFCSNSGAITGKPSNTTYNNHLTNVSMVGGVIGFACGHSSAYDCENTGTVDAHGLVGGVIGFIEGASPSYNAAADRCFVERCVNKGAVTGTDKGVGGVIGSACAQQYWPTVWVLDCENTGAVKSTGDGVGGVVGMLYNNNTSNDLRVLRCKNSGSVEGTLWIGGVVGLGYSRASNLTLAQWVGTISNCENSGEILATRSDKDGGEVAGGIIGTFVTGGNNPGDLRVNNCVNTGSVMYKVVSHKGVYVGGIVGCSRAGTIANVANHGYVGPLGGVENKVEGADARLGAVVGSHDGGSLSHAYYFDASCTQAVGTAGTQVDATGNVAFYDIDGVLETALEVKGEFAFTVSDALNYWIGESTGYYKWGFGEFPYFVTE